MHTINIFAHKYLSKFLETRKVGLIQEVLAIAPQTILRTPEDDLINYFIDRVQIETITIDFDEATVENEERPNPQNPPYNMVVHVLHLPYSGDGQLQEYNPQDTDGVWTRPAYLCKTDSMCICLDLKIFNRNPDELKNTFDIYQKQIKYQHDLLNAKVTQFNQTLPQLVQETIAARKKELLHNQRILEATGIKLKRRDAAVLPIDLSIRKTIQTIRKPINLPTLPPEETLEAETLTAIIRLLDQIGKGFEIAPATYNKLDEEDLSNIIVAYLNGYFEPFTSASRETFSKNGKTDILLKTLSGTILVAECKIWHGSKKYSENIEQLFGYLTFRQTTGILITFSRGKGLTSFIEKAVNATKNHLSYKEPYSKKHETYFITNHFHPNDQDKSLELHHLFFDMQSGNI